MRPVLIIIILSSLSLPVCFAGEKRDVVFLSGPLAPFAFIENGKKKGVVLDIVKEIQRRVNMVSKIKMGPWPRTLKESLKSGRVAFPLARLPYREGLYHWVGPVVSGDHIIVVRNNDRRKYTTLDDFKNLKIGVLRNAPPHKILKKQGFKNLYPLSNTTQIPKMMLKGRLDAWYDLGAIISHTNRLAQIDDANFKSVFRHVHVNHFIVMSRDLGEMAKRWQVELTKMKQEGLYKKILDSYSFKNL